jgi:hypothetical protein
MIGTRLLGKRTETRQRPVHRALAPAGVEGRLVMLESDGALSLSRP